MAQHIKPLKDAGIEVVYTDLERLRDPNPLYSGIWRMVFQWFGQEGNGWSPPIHSAQKRQMLR